MRRTRDSTFKQNLKGTSAQFDKPFSIAGTSNYLIYGGEYYTIDGDNLRTGATFDAVTGAPRPESTPFPTRGFPLSDTTQYAFYIQDEITLLDGRLSIMPGLRYDNYELDSKADPAYVDSNPGIEPPQDFDDSHVSPKLGAVFRINDTWSLFAQYAQGFRAPPYDDINVGFTNFAGGYKTIPNPNLKPETSESYEIGVRAGSR
jgi:hemoglobin/transferrin/lactoferrin receptor protein